MENRRKQIELIEIDEMCEILRCGYSTAYSLLRQGAVHAYKEGRVWKIPKEGVEDYILRRTGYQVAP